MSDPVSRAVFLRRGVKSAAGFFGSLIESLFGDKLDGIARMFPSYVRPPGAISEGSFLETCTRCGACASACTFFAIKRVMTPGSFDEGTPSLLMRDTYCRLCKDLPCAAACKSGALRLPDPPAEPRLGTAEVSPALCLRASDQSCSLCVTACPEKYSAISLTIYAAFPHVDHERCTGCGACEAACIVRPEPAVTITPCGRS